MSKSDLIPGVSTNRIVWKEILFNNVLTTSKLTKTKICDYSCPLKCIETLNVYLIYKVSF